MINTLAPAKPIPIELFPDQVDAYQALRHELRTNDSVMLQASPRFGKTVVAAYIAQQVIKKGGRLCFSVHRKELLRQTMKSFSKYGIKFGIIADGYPANYYEPIQLASIDTLKNRLGSIPKFTVYIPDEAHFCAATGWARVLKYMLDHGAKAVGLSGTPWRLSGEPMGNYFQSMVRGPAVADLIARGRLSSYKLYCPSHADMTKVKTNNGDFSGSSTDEAMEKSAIYGDSINSYKKYAYGMRAVAYCVSRSRCEKYAAELRAAGVTAVAIDGTTSDDARKRAIMDFAEGRAMVLVSCLLVTEGFDLSAQVDMDVTVECIIDLAPTRSLSRHYQKIMRCMTAKDFPAVIIDHANNVCRMINLYGWGFPDDPVEWSLEGREKKARSKNDETEPRESIKQCPECYAVHKPAPVCPECGHVHEVKERKIEEIDSEMTEIDPEAIRRQARQEQGQAKTPGDLAALAAKRGYKPGYADHVARAREEKKRLQDMLYNLCVGARSIGIDPGLRKPDIMRMKPKALKESIAALEQQMRSEPQFNMR